MVRKSVLLLLDILYALWWGGFTFYAAFVVPQGMKVLGDHVKMGMITQSVTNYLNSIGMVALTYSLLISLVFNRKGLSMIRAIGWDWVLLAVLQCALFTLHYFLSLKIHDITTDLTVEHNFYNLHRCYLLTSTAMWVLIPVNYYRVKTNVGK